MTLTEIVQVVVDETRRKDKQDTIHRIVREAINTVHSLRLFPRDMVEDEVVLQSPNLYQFKINLPPRFREFEYVLPLTASGGRMRTVWPDNMYQLITPAELLNNSYNEKKDVFYITGPALAISAGAAPAKLGMAWYALPETADPHLETWLMELHPHAFIDTAKKLFYRRHGREDLARNYDADLQGQYLQIMTDYSQGK